MQKVPKRNPEIADTKMNSPAIGEIPRQWSQQAPQVYYGASFAVIFIASCTGIMAVN